jgi:ubiquinone/menaquinone biosynthesis C-methylase UbiE
MNHTPPPYGTRDWLPLLLKELIAPERGLRVLDIGSSDHTDVVESLEGKIAMYVALDFWESDLENQMAILKSLGLFDRALHVVADSTERLPFIANSFDVVVVGYHPPLVEPGPDRAHVMAEVERVLASNGTAYVLPWRDEYVELTTMAVYVQDTYPPDSPFWEGSRIGILAKL